VACLREWISRGLAADPTVTRVSKPGSGASKAGRLWSFLRVVAIGVVLGLAIGALAGYGAYRPCNDPACFDLGRRADTFGGAVIGAVVGAIALPILWLLWRMCRRVTPAVGRDGIRESTANSRHPDLES
jgi:hypothetical protein